MGTLKRRIIEDMEPKEEPPNESEIGDLIARVYGGGEDAVKAVREFMTCRAAILDSITRAFATPAWVPVSERLPDEGVDVLVSSPCPNSDTPNIDIASWGIEGKQGPVWREADCGRIWPTHWTPLPLPPEAANA